jgi:hypothetical protein
MKGMAGLNPQLNAAGSFDKGEGPWQLHESVLTTGSGSWFPGRADRPECARTIRARIKRNGLTSIGFGCDLAPQDAPRCIAEYDKPLVPIAPHHFSLWGGDDLMYAPSGLVSARPAKEAGIRKVILQIMLNEPASTCKMNELARARALLHLVREFEDGDSKVYAQPRSGADCLSTKPKIAAARLAAIAALMDDMEPGDPASPQMIHVGSFCDDMTLVSPEDLNAGIRVTRHALLEYRKLRDAEAIADLSSKPHILEKTSTLIRDARAAMEAIESSIKSPYAAEGLYEILASGFFAVPDLPSCTEEFAAATAWKTKPIRGSILVVDEAGTPISTKDRGDLPSNRAGRSRNSKRKSAPRCLIGAARGPPLPPPAIISWRKRKGYWPAWTQSAGRQNPFRKNPRRSMWDASVSS